MPCYSPGVDPAWVHSSASGEPLPVSIDRKTGRGRAEGSLSKSTILPSGPVQAVRDFKGGRTPDEAASGWRIPIALGRIADLDDPKFSAERGSAGLWEPASFPLQSGIGIYFLEHPDQIDELSAPLRVHLIFLWAGSTLGALFVAASKWLKFSSALDFMSESFGEFTIDIVFEVGAALIGAAVTAYVLGILLNKQQENAAKWRAEIRAKIDELDRSVESD